MTATLSKEQMRSEGYLLADSLKEAERDYFSMIVRTDDRAQMDRFFESVFTANQESGAADFFAFKLSAEEQERFAEGLDDREKELFSGLDGSEEHFYRLNRDLYHFLYEITAREWLFSSFYFNLHKVIIWGNYNLTFPLFCDSEETLNYYRTLAERAGLICE